MKTKTLLSLLTLFAVGGFILLITVSKKRSFPNGNNSSEVYRLEVKKNQETGYWFYEIYTPGKLTIKQEFVPGTPRRIRFASEQEAKAIGELVLGRLNNKLPPAITVKDLEKHLETTK
ncbi:MAG: DUF4907 domain-containing protein [Bacteroidota bacterium]